MSRETTFENAKVGDKVWDSVIGTWGYIKELKYGEEFSIIVHFYGMGKERYYTQKGVSSYGQNQILFWDEVKFEVPVRPKRKVKKKVKSWANIYDDGVVRTHAEPREALDNASHNAIKVAFPIEIEYEEEE